MPNPLAASSDRHRLIRYMYGPEHGYAAMVAEAYPAWDRLWRDLSRSHYAPTGQLLAGHGDDPWVAGSRQSMGRLGITFRELDKPLIAEHFPLLDADQVDYALYSPSAGALFADAIALDLVAWLGDAGCSLRRHADVVAITPDEGRVVLADGEMLSADHLVVTAGAWTARLMPALEGRLTPSRQLVLYVEPPADLAAHWPASTMLTDVLQGEQQSVFYAVPPLRGLPVKLGDHCFSRGGDPEADRTPTAAEIARLRDAARRLRRADDYRILEAKTCFYTLSPDERFIAEAAEYCTSLTGFSGHGFKFGPLIGERLAATLDGRLGFDGFRDWLAGRAPIA